MKRRALTSLMVLCVLFNLSAPVFSRTFIDEEDKIAMQFENIAIGKQMEIETTIQDYVKANYSPMFNEIWEYQRVEEATIRSIQYDFFNPSAIDYGGVDPNVFEYRESGSFDTIWIWEQADFLAGSLFQEGNSILEKIAWLTAFKKAYDEALHPDWQFMMHCNLDSDGKAPENQDCYKNQGIYSKSMKDGYQKGFYVGTRDFLHDRTCDVSDIVEMQNLNPEMTVYISAMLRESGFFAECVQQGVRIEIIPEP